VAAERENDCRPRRPAETGGQRAGGPFPGENNTEEEDKLEKKKDISRAEFVTAEEVGAGS